MGAALLVAAVIGASALIDEHHIGQAGADALSIAFDASTYAPGSVNGQGGWSALANSPIVGDVVPDTAGDNRLALTHVPANAGVSSGLNSPLIDGAGESGTLNGDVDAGGRNQFRAVLTYRTPAVPVTGAGTFVELNPSSRNPDNTTASRYARAGLMTDPATGDPVVFSSYPAAGGAFPSTGSIPLAWDHQYRLIYDLRLVDGLAADGGPNDTFCITVEDPAGTRLGTIASFSWEAGYVTGGYGGGTGPRRVNGLDLLARYTGSSNQRGFLDHLTLIADTVPAGVIPPDHVAATVNGTSATVTFERPPVDDCTPIGSYTLTNNRDGSTQTVPDGTTSFVASGLTTGQTYTFNVAVNYQSGSTANANANPVTVPAATTNTIAGSTTVTTPTSAPAATAPATTTTSPTGAPPTSENTSREGVVRLAGDDRMATARVLSERAFPGGADTVYIATISAYADALAAGAAASGAGPVLLTPTGSLDHNTAAELARLEPSHIVVMGGPAAISDAVLQALRPYASGNVIRVAGRDRYGTAAALSHATFPSGSPTAYLATGRSYADALGGGLAAAFDTAPVLLTEANVLPSVTTAELAWLKPKRIVIIGGPAAISAGVQASLAALAPAVERVAGADPYATMAKVVARTTVGGTDTAIIVTGHQSADSLTGIPIAAMTHSAVLMVGDNIPAAVAAELTRLEPRTIIVLGGTSAIKARIEAQLTKYVGDGTGDGVRGMQLPADGPP